MTHLYVSTGEHESVKTYTWTAHSRISLDHTSFPDTLGHVGDIQVKIFLLPCCHTCLVAGQVVGRKSYGIITDTDILSCYPSLHFLCSCPVEAVFAPENVRSAFQQISSCIDILPETRIT